MNIFLQGAWNDEKYCLYWWWCDKTLHNFEEQNIKTDKNNFRKLILFLEQMHNLLLDIRSRSEFMLYKKIYPDFRKLFPFPCLWWSFVYIRQVSGGIWDYSETVLNTQAAEKANWSKRNKCFWNNFHETWQWQRPSRGIFLVIVSHCVRSIKSIKNWLCNCWTAYTFVYRHE